MPAIDHPLIDQFLDALWLEKGLSDNTRDAYRSDLTLFNGWLQDKGLELVNAGRELILDHLAWRLEQNYKPRSTARFLSGVMDRHVLDRTGLTDKFVIYLEYAPDDLVPYDFLILPRTADPPTAPSITQVLKSLGLELQPTKGSKGYIVIDHAERPVPNEPSSRPARAKGPTGGR